MLVYNIYRTVINKAQHIHNIKYLNYNEQYKPITMNTTILVSTIN